MSATTSYDVAIVGGGISGAMIAKRLGLPGRTSLEPVSGEIGSRVTFRIAEIAVSQPGDPRRGPHLHNGYEECIYVLKGALSGDLTLHGGGRGGISTNPLCGLIVNGNMTVTGQANVDFDRDGILDFYPGTSGYWVNGATMNNATR